MNRWPLAVCLLLLPVVACRKTQVEAAAQPLPLVRAHTVVASPAAALSLRGSVAAAHRVRLGFKLGGVIGWLGVEEGQRVKQGQVVGRLDGVTARAAVRQAQAARDKAKRDVDRAESLAGSGTLPANVRDDANTGLEVAEATLVTARDALSTMELVAPAAGTVFARLAEPGETVGPGMPVLVIDSTDRLTIRAGATESEVARLTSGLAATIVLADGTSVGGRIKNLAGTPGIEDGLFTVTVAPDDGAQAKLVSGALVRVLFAEKDQRQVIRIALDSLVHRRDQNYVFVLQPAADGVPVRMRPITIDRISGVEAVIRDGLTGGERIVAEGAYFLQDGQRVRVLE